MPAALPHGSSPRFHHLDALRGALMFWGVLVHAGTLDGSALLDRVGDLSGLVRMEAFFLISGFLGGSLVRKYTASEIIRRRTIALGVPLLLCLLALNPATCSLIHLYHNGFPAWKSSTFGLADPAAEGPINWHLHLWFLFSLLVFGWLTPVLDRWTGLLSPRLVTRLSSRLLLVSAAALVAAACLTARVLYEFVLGPVSPDPLKFIVRSTGYHLPFFALGVAAYRLPPLHHAIARFDLLFTFASLAALAAAHLSFPLLPKQAAEAFLLVAEATTALALTSCLWALAARLVPKENRLARKFSDAAYTVYLFHFLLLYGFAVALRTILPEHPVTSILAALATLVFATALHFALIARVPFLRFLFNGRLPSPAPVLARTAKQPG